MRMMLANGFPSNENEGESMIMEASVEVGLPKPPRTMAEMLRNFTGDKEENELLWKGWSEELERLDGICTIVDLQNLTDEEFDERAEQWDDGLVRVLRRYRNLMWHPSRQHQEQWWQDGTTCPDARNEKDALRRNEEVFRKGKYFMIQPCSLMGYVLESPLECGLSPTIVPQSQASANALWTYNGGKKNIVCLGTKLVLNMVEDHQEQVPPGATVIMWPENLNSNQRWEYNDGRLVYFKSLRRRNENENRTNHSILALDVYLQNKSNNATCDPKHLLRMWPEDGSLAQQWNILPAAPPAARFKHSKSLPRTASSQHPPYQPPQQQQQQQQHHQLAMTKSFHNIHIPDNNNNIQSLPPLTRQFLSAQSSISKSFNIALRDETLPRKHNHSNKRTGFYLESVFNPGWCLQMSHLCQGAVTHLVPKHNYNSNVQKWVYYSNSGGGILTNVTFDFHSNNNNNNNNLVLCITRGSDEPGMSVCMWPKNGKSHQSWRLIPCHHPNNNNHNNNDEIVIVQSQHPSRHVLQAEKVQSDTYCSSANVIMWPTTGEDSQKWKVVYPS